VEELTMTRPVKTKTDLFTSMEDDIKQFSGALFGAFRAVPGAIAKRVATTTRTRFAHRLDLWDTTGDTIVEHLAGIEDLELAQAAYRAACERWPSANITLRAGERLIEDSRQLRTAAVRYPLA
jgi:hypothetical protein